MSVKNKKVKCFPFSWGIDNANQIEAIDLSFDLGEIFDFKFRDNQYQIKYAPNNITAFYYKKSWRNHLPIDCKELAEKPSK